MDVRNYIAMIGGKDLPNRMEKVGRFGEKIVLEATAMGLSTCWVGTSYDKKTATALCKENDTLDCVIAIGYSDKKHSLKERMMEYGMHRQNKSKETLKEAEGPVPEWFLQIKTPWYPLFTALYSAISAMAVLPEPTSP